MRRCELDYNPDGGNDGVCLARLDEAGRCSRQGGRHDEVTGEWLPDRAVLVIVNEEDISPAVRHAGLGVRIGASLPGAALLGFLGVPDPARRDRTRIDAAMARLVRCVEVGDLPKVHEEVKRRLELMGTAAAYESVGDDVIAGRWPR